MPLCWWIFCAQFAMSSWLRGAIDKVKEKGVKVATKTREVRSRFLGAGTADELQVLVVIFILIFDHVGPIGIQSSFN